MVDLTPTTIKMIFEERVRELTRQTPLSLSREDYAQKWQQAIFGMLKMRQPVPNFYHFDYQYSGRWLE